MKTFTIIAVAIITALFVGCGGGSSSSKAGITAQLVDSPIAGVTYICQDGTSGVTDGSGMFTCNAAPVRFRIGNLQLGVIDPIPSDNMIFPQDLLGLNRDTFGDPSLIILTRLLQSMDSDGDIAQTIAVPSDMAEKFNNCYSELEVFDLRGKDDTYMQNKLYEYAACAGITPVSGEDAINHLQEYYNTHVSSSSSSSSSNGDGGAVSSQNSSSQNSTSSSQNSESSHSSSQAEAGTWNIDVDFKGRSYSHKWHWNNVKIAATTDALKTEWDDTYPFPYTGSYGDAGTVLVDTSFYNADDSDGLIVSYYSENYGVNNGAIFVKKGFCLDASWIDALVTEYGDTSFGCSNDIYTSSWDIINTSLNADQQAAFLAHKAFTFNETGRWVNDGGSSSLTIIFIPTN